MSRSSREIVADFARLYYQARSYSRVSWQGVEIIKYPSDLLVYAELVWRVRPHLVISTGTFKGGDALFFATQLDAVGHGQVVTIDVNDWSGPEGLPDHPRITYVRGSSTDPAVTEIVRDLVPEDGAVMAVLDSCHDESHVVAELNAYGPLVTRGSYLVVEDTNVHEVRDDYGPGPDDALAKWLPEHPEFVVDRSCERFMLTAAPGGWLRRV